MDASTQELFTRKQVARILGVGYWTVIWWEQHGRIESFKLGGRRRIRRSEIKRILAHGLRPAGPRLRLTQRGVTG